MSMTGTIQTQRIIPHNTDVRCCSCRCCCCHQEITILRRHRRTARQSSSSSSSSITSKVSYAIVTLCGIVLLRISKTISFTGLPSFIHQRQCWTTNEQLYDKSYNMIMNIKTISAKVNIDYNDIDDTVLMDDNKLLNFLSLEQLQQLCDQCQGVVYDTVHDTKIDLLHKLRQYANDQAEIEQQRLISKRISKVENGCNDNEDDGNSNSKERYEITGGNDMLYQFDDNFDNENDTDVNGYFYFDLPKITTDLKEAQERSHQNVTESKQLQPNNPKSNGVLTSDQVTAPPIPSDVVPNSNGERVVKTYSTKDMNDLTGIAASQPGYTSFDTLLSNGGGGGSSTNDAQQQLQPWDTERQMTSATTSNQQMEHMKEQLIELVSTLLAMSGAPAFVTASLQDDDDDDEDEVNKNDPVGYVSYDNIGTSMKNGKRPTTSRVSNRNIKAEFVGFNPTKVPVELLTKSSKAIRAGRGAILEEVLQQYEMQGIGYDGMAGDNIERGGGHYREVQKVSAFLNGYRRAEVRRMARETITVLLEKIMIEGIDSLDTTLRMMIRSDDDISSSSYGGDDSGGTTLNDSLMDYLNDMIRQKEKEVDEKFGKERKQLEAKWTEHLLQQQDNEDDITNGMNNLDQYWNVTEIDGQRVEIFDPNNDNVKQILQNKLDQSSVMNGRSIPSTTLLPQTAPEQVLLLLKLLRERIKAEAIYSYDEKGRNLRLLAYCLHISTQLEREQLILKQLGNSIDRLDSFIELVTSSIEYGESTSYELRPSTTKQQQSLNVHELKQILQLSIDLRYRQSVKAAGLSP